MAFENLKAVQMAQQLKQLPYKLEDKRGNTQNPGKCQEGMAAHLFLYHLKVGEEFQGDQPYGKVLGLRGPDSKKN